jgi:membrane protease YdiL (CAAX protease family)
VARWLDALMIAAPASVVVALLVFRSALLVFVLYHVGFCLLLPLVVDLRRRGWNLRTHFRHLGVAGPGAARAFGQGLGIAGVTAAVAGLALVAARDGLPTGANLTAALARWGVPADRAGPVLVFIALVNGPAEELFWRGFVAAELRPAAGRLRRLLTPSLAFAGYHAVTIPALVPEPALAGLMLGAVLVAGTSWAWLRERTGSLWPALLSHTIAGAMYAAVAADLLTP